MIYDTIIIGQGLTGSAAAKYLSQSMKNVAILGPDESTASKEGIIFSSHYDQSRIQRIIGKDETWTLLNKLSVEQYASLEEESKIRFHSGVGCLYVNPYGSDFYLDKVFEQGKRFGLDFQSFQNNGSIISAFPDLNIPKAAKGIFETSPSGYINPRLLIQAQLNIFQKNGGKIFNETANDLNYANGQFIISTLSGKIYRSKKILLATGAFINFFKLLKRKLVLNLKSETTIWAKVNNEEAQRLSGLPSLLYEIEESEIKNIYLLPPVQYADGNYYVKMGANIPDDIFFKDLDEIQHWFEEKENNKGLDILRNTLHKLISKLAVEEYALKKCIVAFTQHGKPYIGEADRDLYFVSGGNGYSAMCSDALGSIAASLVMENKFPGEFSPKDFEPVFVV